jgi:hypothetical protein
MVSLQKPREASGFESTAQMTKDDESPGKDENLVTKPEEKTAMCNIETPYQESAILRPSQKRKWVS